MTFKSLQAATRRIHDTMPDNHTWAIKVLPTIVDSNS